MENRQNPQQEYCCFLHPDVKGESLEQTCSKCGERFDFPVQFPPSEIEGEKVLEGLNRGFYGAIIITQHPRITSRKFAVKVIPKASYDYWKKGRETWEREIQDAIPGPRTSAG